MRILVNQLFSDDNTRSVDVYHEDDHFFSVFVDLKDSKKSKIVIYQPNWKLADVEDDAEGYVL